MSTLSWTQHGATRTTRWHSENGSPAPGRLVVVDDTLTADAAVRFARSGTGLLWQGDFPNARNLLRAMDRRLRRRRATQSGGGEPGGGDPGQLFLAQRAARAERANLLGSVLILLEEDHSVVLRRAPDVRAACDHAYGVPGPDAGAPTAGRKLVSLPELLGVISAHEWHKKGIDIPSLGARIHPAYGVFAPTRDEYIDLVARAPLPEGAGLHTAVDLGTGTGVLAVLLARRGFQQVLATDINPRAVRCAAANARRLGLADRIRTTEADLWPGGSGRADLIVCNPPWLPGIPSSALELGIYDQESEMLRRFLARLPEHLTPQGEGWLILSDLAEHLGLRTRDQLLALMAEAGLRVVARHDTAPRHPRAADRTDAVHAARSRERTTLWRLRPR